MSPVPQLGGCRSLHKRLHNRYEEMAFHFMDWLYIENLLVCDYEAGRKERPGGTD